MLRRCTLHCVARSMRPPPRVPLRREFSTAPPPAASDGPPPPTPTPPPKKGIKALFKEYGPPFLVYWTSVWACTGVGLYVALQTFDVDAVKMLEHVNIHLNIDPSLGNAAVAIALNEALEVVRLPACIATFKPAYARYRRWKDGSKSKPSAGGHD